MVNIGVEVATVNYVFFYFSECQFSLLGVAVRKISRRNYASSID